MILQDNLVNGISRNLRSKTSRQTIKPTASIEVPTIVIEDNEEEIQVQPIEVKEEKKVEIFPVKSVLKKDLKSSNSKSSTRDPIHDKENINKDDLQFYNWDDLDSEDIGDPLMVSDYVIEIFDYMKNLEVNLGFYLSLLIVLIPVCLFVFVVFVLEIRNSF